MINCKAELTVVGAWLINFCTFGYASAFGVYQDYYTRSFLEHHSPSEISWLGSFQLFMMYAPGVIVGRAFDAGYFHQITLAGSCVYVVSIFMLSLVRPEQYYQVFLTQAIGMGIGQGMLFLPALTVIGHHFKQKRALATGIVVTGASAGGIVFPIMLDFLANRVSFTFAIRISAAVVAVLLVVANVLVSTPPPRPESQHQQVEDPNRKQVRAILFDAPYIVSIIGALFTTLGLFFPYFYLQLYAIRQGVPPETAFYSLAILNASSVLGRLLPSFFADRLGVYNMLVPSLLASAVVLFGMMFVRDFTGVIVFGSLYGFTSGAYISLIPPLLGQLTTEISELGTRMGIAFSVVAFAMLIGTPVDGGFLGHHRFLWRQAIVFCGICVLAGSMFMMLSRWLFVRDRGKHLGWRV